jgi:transketolase
MTGFGASAPASVLYEKFGITAHAVADAARRSIARTRGEGDGLQSVNAMED